MKRIKKTIAAAALISMVAIPASAEISTLADGHQLSAVQNDPARFCQPACPAPAVNLAGTGVFVAR